jgi:uncharacterized glyoxalase superfamily protein PhnB
MTAANETKTVESTLSAGLFYRDADAAIDWLERAFGFERIGVFRGEDGSVVHAELRFGPAVVMLSSAAEAQGIKSPRDLGGRHGYTNIVVDDDALPAHYERAKAAGAEISQPLEKKHYGGSGYSVRDIEGHSWSFGSYRPGTGGDDGS